jgi:hypothetical protein
MPRLIPSRPAAACALALILLLAGAAPAAAGGVPANLRVIGGHGRVLAEKRLRAGTTRLPTSRRATCLGRGSGGSGHRVTVKGPTALGLLGRAARSDPALRPLLITDHFLAEFGLGLCGVGGIRSHGSFSWYLKVNHRNPQVGGDSVRLHAGDEVLWAFAPYPYPDELSLVAPFSAHPGAPFEVTVYAYDDKGRREPAAGATVTGAALPTDANGHTMVTLTEEASLVAKHGKDIPSGRERVVMCAPDGACPVP